MECKEKHFRDPCIGGCGVLERFVGGGANTKECPQVPNVSFMTSGSAASVEEVQCCPHQARKKDQGLEVMGHHPALEGHPNLL